MAGLQHVATLAGGSMAYLSGIYDLQVISTGSTALLHSASAALGGVTSFSLQTGGQAQFQTQTAYPTTSVSYANVPWGSGTIQLSLMRLTDMLAAADTALSGNASGTPVFIRNTGFTGDLVTMLAVTLPGGTTCTAASMGRQASQHGRCRGYRHWLPGPGSQTVHRCIWPMCRHWYRPGSGRPICWCLPRQVKTA